MSTGLMCLDCSGVTTENSAICVCFFIEIWWFRCICHSDCYSLVNYCGHWVGNQQTCCFRKFLQRCYSSCCVPFWWIVNESFDRFCGRWWYGQEFVNCDWLWFGGCLTWGCFNLHRQVGEMYEAMCRVNDYTAVPHKMQSNYWSC